MTTEIDENNLEVRWGLVGWTFIGAFIYDKSKLNNKFKRWLSRYFGYGRVHEVTCTRCNGFKDRYFDHDIEMMTKTGYNEKIVKPAIAHYKKLLAAQKTWE